jgi:cbb3-type cytochrome oxidase subunit 3
MREWIADALGVILLFGILYGVLFLGAVVAP